MTRKHKPRFPVRFPQSPHTVVMFLTQLERIPKYCLQGPIFKVDLIATKFQFFIPSNQVTICPTAPVVSCKNVKLCLHLDVIQCLLCQLCLLLCLLCLLQCLLCLHWMSYNAHALFSYWIGTQNTEKFKEQACACCGAANTGVRALRGIDRVSHPRLEVIKFCRYPRSVVVR